MSSLKRREAARINGAKSRGPITPSGKAVSSMNALRHGMCAKSLVLTNEDEQKFQTMRDGYMQHFQPEGEVELDLLEEVISSRWRQRRIWGIETALLDLQMDQQMKEIEDQFNRIDETTRTAIAYKSLADTSKSLTQTTRHEALFSRQYRLAMKTLIQIQKERKEANLQNEPKQTGPGQLDTAPPAPNTAFGSHQVIPFPANNPISAADDTSDTPVASDAGPHQA